MDRIRSSAARLPPPPGLPRVIAYQSAVVAVGSGSFLTGSLVFFTHVLGLSPVQIGIGFSIAGFVVLMTVAAATDSLANAGRTIYTADAMPAGDRVRTMAYARAYLNAGFTLGTGLGALALAFDSSTALVVMVLCKAAVSLLGAMLALNTLLVITLQVPMSRGADSLPGSARLIRRGALVTAVACPVAAFAGRTDGGWTVVALLLVVVLITTTELWFSAALWFFQTNVPPAAARGMYLGTAQLVSSVADIFAPVGLTLLAISTGGWGWWVVAAIFTGCAVVAGPTVRWVARTPGPSVTRRRRASRSR